MYLFINIPSSYKPFIKFKKWCKSKRDREKTDILNFLQKITCLNSLSDEVKSYILADLYWPVSVSRVGSGCKF